MSVLICSEPLHMTKIICTGDVKTARNVEPASWSKMLGPESGFLVPDLKS